MTISLGAPTPASCRAAVGSGRESKNPARAVNSAGSFDPLDATEMSQALMPVEGNHSPPVTSSVARRSERFAARQFLWKHSKIERRRRCGRVPTVKNQGAALMLSGEGRASYLGLETCSSVWSCPVCSAQIHASYAGQIANALTHHLGNGGGAAMVTLTMRHKKGDPLSDLWAGLGEAWRAATRGKEWDKERAEYGVLGTTRIVETTFGENGWHLHVHALIFFSGKPTVAELELLGKQMFQRWRTRLTTLGLRAPLANSGGLDIRPVYSSDELGAYLNKLSSVDEIAISAAQELSHSDTKTGRSGGRTPWQILGDGMQEKRAAPDMPSASLGIWHEWEDASRGKRFMVWSRNTSPEWLAILDARGEVQTEEQATVDPGPEAQLVGFIPREAWLGLIRHHRPAIALILNAVEAEGLAGAARCLAHLGLPPPIPPPRSQAAA